MANSTSDMPLRGGHPALDFANTVDSRRGRWGPDLLQSFDDITMLARRLGLIDERQAAELNRLAQEHPRDAKASLDEAVKLREAIYVLFRAEAAEKGCPDPSFEIIHQIARRGRAKQILENTTNGLRWRQPVNEPVDLVDLFASEAASLLTERGKRRAIRECRGDNCGWLFLDTSKSGRRLWCSDASCGNHQRVKRFRSKRD